MSIPKIPETKTAPPGLPSTTKPKGQRVSKERGSHTHKKNPGKRPKQGGS